MSAEREQSPQPDEPEVSNHLRPTRASTARSQGSPPNEAPSPTRVAELAKMTPMDRVKLEHKQHCEQALRPRSGRGFGSSDGRLSAQQRCKTQQMQRHEEVVAQRQEERSKGMPTSPAHHVKPAVKQPKSSWWAKSVCSSDRHTFQRRWPRKTFPLPERQKSMDSFAPGPGRYGDSTSFVAVE